MHGMSYTGSLSWSFELWSPKRPCISFLICLGLESVFSIRRILYGSEWVSLFTLMEPLFPLRKHWSLGQSLSAISFRWSFWKWKWVNSPTSVTSWTIIFFFKEWNFSPCLSLFDHAPAAQFQSAHQLCKLNQHCSLQTIQTWYHHSQRPMTKMLPLQLPLLLLVRV